MTEKFAGSRRPSSRVTGTVISAVALLFTVAVSSREASAQALGYASTSQGSFSSTNVMFAPAQPAVTDEDEGSGSVLPERLRRMVVSFDSREVPGTIIIDTGNTALYYILGQGRAMRYGVGVGRDGFTWSGVQTITRKAEWPDWYPPAEMIARQPYLPRFVAGGPGNPLGARAMYLGSSAYRIHGTNDPSTIGKFVSSGCIRLTNEDVADLFSRVEIGAKVVVLPKNSLHLESRGMDADGANAARSIAARARPLVTTLPSGRQAMNLSPSSLH